jgi:predicted peptidase
VVCTGFSMGGAGTWYLAGRHPDRFTAAIPIAGRPAELDFQVPVYVIHSRADQVMPLGPTEAYVARLKAAGRPAELVVVDGITHFQTDRFVEPLRAAIPWLERTWAGP